MPKINRLEELNKLWIQLTAPQVGDKIKFKIKGDKNIYDGVISRVQKNEAKNKIQFAYQVQSFNAPSSMRYKNIEIIEFNGVKYKLTEKSKAEADGFRPI